LWGAVVVVGGYVLLPAAVDLVRTRQQEENEQEIADEAQGQLQDAQQRLIQVGEDPQALQKIREAQELEARRENRHD